MASTALCTEYPLSHGAVNGRVIGVLLGVDQGDGSIGQDHSSDEQGVDESN
jgi:sorbitol-specific phosphotransferase system component IIBC